MRTQMFDLTTQLFGPYADLARYRLVCSTFEAIEAAKSSGIPAPFIALALYDSQFDVALGANFRDGFKTKLKDLGFTPDAIEMLMIQFPDVQAEFVTQMIFTQSHWATIVAVLNLIAPILYGEALSQAGFFSPMLNGVASICRWGSWSRDKGLLDSSTERQRANAQIFAQALFSQLRKDFRQVSPPMATSNSPTYGQSNSSMQDERIMRHRR